MKMSNEVATINNNFPSQLELQSVQLIARTAHASSMYSGVGGEAKIMMILLAAKELGVGPCQALNGGIWSIQGKIEISARLMNGLIRRAGHSIKIVKSDDTGCTLLGKRTDGDSFECSFTMEDAIKAGLWGTNTWKKYPSDMLYNRCMSRLARRLFSDVIGNSYVEGEIREAKEVERMEMAECEDITKPAPSHQKAQIAPVLQDECKAALQGQVQTVPSPAQVMTVEKIDQAQSHAITEALAQTDEEFKIKFFHRLNEIGLTSIHDLPCDKYLTTMNWIKINIDRIKNTTMAVT